MNKLIRKITHFNAACGRNLRAFGQVVGFKIIEHSSGHQEGAWEIAQLEQVVYITAIYKSHAGTISFQYILAVCRRIYLSLISHLSFWTLFFSQCFSTRQHLLKP